MALRSEACIIREPIGARCAKQSPGTEGAGNGSLGGDIGDRMTKKLVHKKTGCIRITRRQGDRIAFEIEGREIGYIEFSRIPHESRISVAVCMDRDVKVTRPDRG